MPVEYGARERSFELYRKGKVEGTWDPDGFDLSRDAEDWATFSEAEQRQFLALASGFYDGEENVTRTLAPYMAALDALDDEAMPFDTVQEEIYLAQQLYEEAKHTDFFSRYYEEVFDTQDTAAYRQTDQEGYGTEDLYDMADELMAAVRGGDQSRLVDTLAMGYLNYMGIIEAQLARAGYMSFDQMIDLKADAIGEETLLPAFQEAVGLVRQDETRHIENGRWMLRQFADHDPAIVTRVYEPRMVEYIDARLLVDDSAFDRSEAYEGYDTERIGRQSIKHLQDTVDYIGADRFDRLADVETAVAAMREREDAPAADD